MLEPSRADPLQTSDYCPPPSTDPGTTGPDYGLETRSGSEAPLPNIPGYEVFDELGKGGMGIVYRGRQVAADRVVALKMILGGGALDDHALARFRTEAQAVARLQHPNIVQVFEVGEWRAPDGGPVPFFSLEFCPGGSLATKLAGTPLPPAEAAALVETLARAMQSAHDKGVIHRDLKPGNVLFAEDGAVKVTDFGLAKKLDDDAGVTAPDAVMGTPSYMAPEQARGEVVGPLADVYALGAILYECLTGRPPFRAATRFETVQQVIAAEPVAPRALQPGVPRDLETVCLKCLRKEPARRYATAAELADDLGRFRAGEPIVARPVGLAERAVKWARRRPTAASLVGVLTLGTLLLVGGTAGFTYHLDKARLDAIDQKGIADEERGRAEGALRQSRVVSANMALDRGLTLGDQGNAGTGLLWFARGLEFAPADEGALRSVLLANLAAWGGQLSVLQARLEHDSGVNAAVFTPDGKAVLSGTSKGAAWLWDARTGRRLSEPVAHPAQVLAVAVSPDGKTGMTGCLDGRARVWDLDAPSRSGQPFTHDGPVTAVAFHPDGRSAATGSADGTARLWDLATRAPIGDPLRHGGKHKVVALAFRPDGKELLTAGSDKTVRRWEVPGGKPVGDVLREQAAALAVAWHPGGKMALTGGMDHTARAWDLTSAKPVGRALLLQGMVFAVAVSPDGTTMATGDDSGTVQLWDGASGQPIGQPLLHPRPVRAVAFEAGGKRLLTACLDFSVRVWDLAAGHPVATLPRLDPAVLELQGGAAVRPDGKVVAFRSLRGDVQVVDAATGQPSGPARRVGGSVVDLQYSPDGTAVLVAAASKGARLYDAASWEAVGPPLPLDGAVDKVGFAGRGKLLLTVRRDGQVQAWDAATRAAAGPPLKHPHYVTSVAGSPDGKTVLTGGVDAVARLWDLRMGATLLELGQEGSIDAVAYSPDGRRVATGGGDKVARVWDAASGRPVSPPLRHLGGVTRAVFSRDGRRLLTASDDRAARLWDVETGKRIGPDLRHPGPVYSAWFGADGRTVFTLAYGADRRLRSWCVTTGLDVEPERLALWVESLSGQRLDSEGGVYALTAAEWRERRGRLAALGGSPLQ